jgi:hypothetical protein
MLAQPGLMTRASVSSCSTLVDSGVSVLVRIARSLPVFWHEGAPGDVAGVGRLQLGQQKADSSRTSRYVRIVPARDSCAAA